MKIIVISDTHIPSAGDKLPDKLVEVIRSADMVLHAGDFASREFYEELNGMCNLQAVAGNMDEDNLISILPRNRVVEILGRRIGLIHGAGSSKHTFQYVQNVFRDKNVDAVVFGHTHHPFNEMNNGILFFNPGSPLDNRWAPYHSYGILDVTDEGISGKIVKID